MLVFYVPSSHAISGAVSLHHLTGRGQGYLWVQMKGIYNGFILNFNKIKKKHLYAIHDFIYNDNL